MQATSCLLLLQPQLRQSSLFKISSLCLNLSSSNSSHQHYYDNVTNYEFDHITLSLLKSFNGSQPPKMKFIYMGYKHVLFLLPTMTPTSPNPSSVG